MKDWGYCLIKEALSPYQLKAMQDRTADQLEGERLAGVPHTPSAACCRLLAACCLPPAVGCWLLAVCCLLPVVCPVQSVSLPSSACPRDSY